MRVSMSIRVSMCVCVTDDMSTGVEREERACTCACVCVCVCVCSYLHDFIWLFSFPLLSLLFLSFLSSPLCHLDVCGRV